MKVVFVGDLFLGGDLIGKDLKSCINVKKFHEADYRVVNLEHPISDIEEKASKSTLFTGSEVLETLKNSGINAVNLANNHIHDKLDGGILDTFRNLDKVNVSYFGAGVNLTESKKPHWINKRLCILGYCQFNSPTLNDIRLATEHTPGVAPLILEDINKDLNLLPIGTKAILYFHWGREHVWFTQRKNIELAKSLLKNDKVAMVLGTHPHRIQGYLSNKNKKAFFSIGNFLFPNFHIKPRTEVVNGGLKNKLNKKIDITRQYHTVDKITYKKWRFVNRVSQLIEYDTETEQAHHYFLYQEDNRPNVKELKGLPLKIFVVFTKYINIIYRLPKIIYIPLERFFSKSRFIVWRLQIMIFRIKQIGIFGFLKRRFGKNE